MYLSGEAPSRTRQARVRSITVLAVRCYSGLVRLLGRVAELAACRGGRTPACQRIQRAAGDRPAGVHLIAGQRESRRADRTGWSSRLKIISAGLGCEPLQ